MRIDEQALLEAGAEPDCEQLARFREWLDGRESVTVTDDAIRDAAECGLDVEWIFGRLDIKYTGWLDFQDGDLVHYRNGLPHHDDGPAIYAADGSVYWCLDGQLHRDGGPAVLRWRGGRSYYRRGKLHREDGPALLLPSGSVCYALDGEILTRRQWRARVGR